jgi:hypothetical protein
MERVVISSDDAVSIIPRRFHRTAKRPHPIAPWKEVHIIIAQVEVSAAPERLFALFDYFVACGSGAESITEFLEICLPFESSPCPSISINLFIDSGATNRHCRIAQVSDGVESLFQQARAICAEHRDICHGFTA